MAHVLFPTAFGVCAIAWHDAGITRFQLPEATEAQTEKRMARPGDAALAEGEAPPGIMRTIERVRLHLAGTPQDFSDAAFDWSLASDFQVAVYRQTLLVKSGYKTSYGLIAKALALGPESSRAVGVALASNPWPLLVPCHRVVSAGDKMTGFSGPGGVRTKTRLLALEGAELLSE